MSNLSSGSSDIATAPVGRPLGAVGEGDRWLSGQRGIFLRLHPVHPNEPGGVRTMTSFVKRTTSSPTAAAMRSRRLCWAMTVAASSRANWRSTLPFHISHLVHAVDVGRGLVLAEDIAAGGADCAAAVGPVAAHAGHDHPQATAAEGRDDAVHHHVDRGLVAADDRPVADHGLHRTRPGGGLAGACRRGQSGPGWAPGHRPRRPL